MAIQYGYNMPMAQTPYGYQQMPQQSFAQAPMPMAPQLIGGRNTYMIQVDGEMAAKAWQCPPDMKAGDVIPLWDADGVHVYFKSLDGYGRLNPTRKARIIFEDEPQAIPENVSGSAPRQNTPAGDSYVSRSEFNDLRNDIASIRQMMTANHQNGRNQAGSGNQMNKGGNENV